MNVLHTTQRHYDRQIPEDNRTDTEIEIDALKSGIERRDQRIQRLETTLRTILDTAEKSSFKAVGLLYLREVAAPVLRKGA